MKSKKRITRFTPVQRLFHVLLMMSYLLLGATGLSRLDITSEWGRWLAGVFGGYESALVVHKYAVFFIIVGFIVHALYLLTKINTRTIIGPDSLLPRPKDVTIFLRTSGGFSD